MRHYAPAGRSSIPKIPRTGIVWIVADTLKLSLGKRADRIRGHGLCRWELMDDEAASRCVFAAALGGDPCKWCVGARSGVHVRNVALRG